MNINKLLTLLLVSATILALFVGCSNKTTTESSEIVLETDPDAIVCSNILPMDLIDNLSGNTLETKVTLENYYEETAISGDKSLFTIDVNYPQFSGMQDSTLESSLNSYVKAKVLGYIDDYHPKNTEVSITLNGEITLLNKDLISMFFRGSAYAKDAVHPTNLLFTLNINPNTMAEFSLNNYVKFDETFLNAIVKLPLYDDSPEINQAVSEYLLSTGLQSTLTSLDKIDATDSDAASYYKPDAVVIVLYFTHAMGDYIEYSIPYA